MAQPLRGRGGGLRAWPLRKKRFFEALKKSPKKSPTKIVKFLVARPLKGVGGGVKGLATKKKELFLKL